MESGICLENAVYLELRRLGYIVYTGSFRDKEVDFVAMKDDRVIYLQATYMLETAQTMEREYAPLLTIGDNYENMSFPWMRYNSLPMKGSGIYRLGI